MQTPEATRPRSASGTWSADLDAYIGSHEGSPGGSSTETRHRLVAGVKARPQSAEAWRALLAYEESHGSNMTHGLQADPGRVRLYHMYYWATTLVPRSSSKSHKEAYLQLWLGLARQQWARSPDDARDTFKTLKNQHIGDASAHLFYEWACLEHAAGNVSKALGVLAKGFRAEAQPASLLEQLRAEMQSGTFDLKQAGAYTETLTLDASFAAARQLQQGSNTATAGAGAGVMSNTILEHTHAARAVTFAADVHDAATTEEYGRRHASSAGPASVCSSRSGRPGADGHTGCTSSSTSSRSTVSVHDGAFLPFSAGAASYKSSETESSGMESTEEDTISCRAAGTTGGISSKEPGSVKRSTAPLSSHSSATPAANPGSNTATLATGLKRFGFKGTPRAGGKHKDEAGWPAGNWTPPAEGQLPSSLDSTPEGAILGGTSTAFTAPTARHSSRVDPPQSQQRTQQQSRGGAGATAAGSRQAAAQRGTEPEAEEDQQALPTIVLSDVPSCAPAAADQAGAKGSRVQQEQQQQQQAEKQHLQPHRSLTSGSAAVSAAGSREPLRPLQSQPQATTAQGTRYTKLECVGRGGSSKVFKVMGPSCKIYALKRIRLAGRDAEAASGFIDEINLLLRLRNKPNIIQLIDSQVFTDEGLIYMVQEYGEIDLARLLAKHDAVRRAAAGVDLAKGGLLQDNLDENFIRLYWQQMLQAVSGVHDQRIVHSDLKPANFLLVEGQLKLIDFGIAKAICGDTTSIARESQVGTLNYMSPEAILGGSTNILGGPAMRVGRPSDVWSLGCILYQMVYGRTPFAELPFLPKMHAICNPQHQVAYPALANTDLMDVMRRCLDRDPKTRISLQELLDHPFLHPNRRLPPPAAAAPAVGLSEEQMKALVAQVAAAGAAGVADIDKLTRDLMQKLQTATLPDAVAKGAGSSQQAASGLSRSRSGSRIPAAPAGAHTAAQPSRQQ
ncbi:hypothetical protein OEZ85_008142 [Tetradesmus obliquus]|uniref:Protein kinase domain-containing protein n=1 Tax=Tetradesmus obliquus TaxID=3088 RepID=A0ABY8TMM0_TETOB|nr:hypothetical protein OEZ85_008142 [Tetradesmus obliquus]